jgi:surface antigen
MRLAFAAMLLAATLATPVYANGWIALLKNTPAERFDDEDIGMFVAAAKTALDAEGEPKPVAWSNPATGSGGSFTELDKSVAKDGSPCKRLRITTYAKGRSEKAATWSACKGSDGRWRFGKPS